MFYLADASEAHCSAQQMAFRIKVVVVDLEQTTSRFLPILVRAPSRARWQRSRTGSSCRCVLLGISTLFLPFSPNKG